MNFIGLNQLMDVVMLEPLACLVIMLEIFRLYGTAINNATSDLCVTIINYGLWSVLS